MVKKIGKSQLITDSSSGEVIIKLLRSFFYVAYGYQYYSKFIDYYIGYIKYTTKENNYIIDFYWTGYNTVNFAFKFIEKLEYILVDNSLNSIVLLNSFKAPKYRIKEVLDMYEKVFL